MRLLLAARGADVALSYVENHAAAEETAEQIRGMGRRAVVLQGDASDAEANVALVDAAVEALGPLRHLVCNAANGSFGTLDELTAEAWDHTMAAHSRALLMLAKGASASMRENGGGAIVAISSLGARRVYGAYAAFGTAKAAIEALVRYLAVELGPHGIRANCVVGGVVLTDLFRAIPEWARSPPRALSGRPCAPCSIPRTSPPRSRSCSRTRRARITGQSLVVDAGFTLPG